MYAVVEIGGMQWRVAKKDTVRVPKVQKEVGITIDFDRVLLLVDKGKVEIGKPFLSGMKVKATVVSHGKADKVKVFKKKRRKGYRVLKGHRQDYTEIRIDSIGAGKAVPKSEKTEIKQEPAKKTAAPKTAASKKEAALKKQAAPKKQAASKKAAESKPASSSKPKTAAKSPASKKKADPPASKMPAPKKTSDTKKEG